jgi:hypothetical protein
MRKLYSLLIAGLLAAGVAGQASAATLDFNGEFSVQVATLDPIAVTAAGIATVNGSTNGSAHLDMLQIADGVFQAMEFLEITDPGASPIAALSAAVSNATGTFSAPNVGSTSGVFGGTMGVPGSAIVCLFTSTCTGGAIVVPFTVDGKGVGLGGSPTPHATVGAAIAISVTGAGWTVGTVGAQSGPIDGPFTTAFQTGFAHGPASAELSSAAQASGVISLVTPVQVNTNIGPSGSLPVFGRLTLHFVPEPGTLILLGAGVAGLAAIGRKRSRS